MHNVPFENCILPDGEYVIVGDLQNNYDVLPPLMQLATKKLFVGDYLDSWPYVANVAKQVQGFHTLLQMIERGDALAVYGNHDGAYTMPMARCSGYNSLTQMQVNILASQARRSLAPFLYHPSTRTLFTHAGISEALWQHEKLSLDTLPETLYEWSLNPASPFYWIGRARGGGDPTGGPLWSDWHQEFTPVAGLTQVVGHTASFSQRAYRDGIRVGNLRAKGTSWNVDCLGKDLKEAREKHRGNPPVDMLTFDTTYGFSGMVLRC